MRAPCGTDHGFVILVRPMSSVFKRPAIRNSIALIVGLGITALAFFTLSRLLSETPLDQVASAIKAMPWSTLGAALAFTALSFMAMAAYDAVSYTHLRAHET